MLGGKNSNPRGFTIIEVMLFMAISGSMFIMAAGFINGKQAKAEFRDGVNTFNQQIQTMINEVSEGYFPGGNSSFACTAAMAGGAPQPVAGSPGQGANQDCVSLGKVLQLAPGGASTKYNVYTVAGRQFAVGSAIEPPASLTDSKPTAITKLISPSWPELTAFNTTEWNLSFTSAKYSGSSIACTSANAGAIGFFTSPANFDASGNTLLSGSQAVVATCVPNAIFATSADPHNDPAYVAGQIANISDNTIVPANYDVLTDTPLIICVNGGKGEYASITIGSANGQKLATNVQIGDSQCAS